MNTAEIGAYIKHPQRLGKEQVEDLKGLCETHPYSGLLHLLYLKALGNSKSVDFDNQLKDYAIKIPNRELLYYLIHEDIPAEESVLELVADEVQNSIIADEALLPNSDDALLVEEVQSEFIREEQESQIVESESVALTANEEHAIVPELEVPADELHEVQPTLVEAFEEVPGIESGITNVTEETTVIEAESSKEESIESPADPDDLAENSFGESFVESPFEEVSWLDNTITFEGFSDSLTYGNDADEESDQESEPIVFDMEALLDGTISNETDIQSDIAPETQRQPDETEIQEIQVSDKRKSFYDWLYISPEPSSSSAIETDENQPVQEVESEGASDVKNDMQPLAVESSESMSEKSKEKVQSLVDKFIEAEPRISRPKAEFFSPVKSAKESVSEEGIPVSETLAKIYELQGNYPKAIAVLEKLIELLPNKRETFETKIADIKAKMVG